MKRLIFALGAALLLNLPAVAQSSVLEGKVFQVELMEVYVEGPDHTAVRIPGDVATFIVEGTPTDYCGLKVGQPVTVQYKPGFNTLSVFPPGYQVTGTENYKRDSVINGQVVHHLWSNGKWTRIP